MDGLPDRAGDDLTTTSSTDVLLAQIEQACRQLKMAQTTFGRLAVNDGKLVSRLQQGTRVTLGTVERVHRFIEESGGSKSNALRSAIRGLDGSPPVAETGFFDHQKYLMFVNTTSEKQQIARHALLQAAETNPQPPAIRLMDAGAGDGTVLAHLLRGLHRRHPTAPFYAVAKETNMANVRLILAKMADRLLEHPATVIVLTNLKYAESLRLKPHAPEAASRMIWLEVPLDGSSSAEFDEQLGALDVWLGTHWQTKMGDEGGNARYATPAVLVLYRRDHRFALEPMIPKRGLARADFDFILLSHSYRARASLAFKSLRVITPLVRGLRPNGRLMGVQGFGSGPAMEVIHELWPDEHPFVDGRDAILDRVRADLGGSERDYQFHAVTDDKAVFRYDLRTTQSEIDTSLIVDSTIFAAWNAATYTAQIEEDRLAQAMARGSYQQITQDALARHGGLWFYNETFVISRRPALD